MSPPELKERETGDFARAWGGISSLGLTLSAAWAERGRKVLAVDLDPQAALTYSLGFEPDDVEPTIHDVLAGRTPATASCTRRSRLNNMATHVSSMAAPKMRCAPPRTHWPVRRANARPP